MSYDKSDISSVAIKLGRLVNGGVVGYYAGGKTSEVMSKAIPERLIGVVERHKKIALGASLAQSFIPGAGIAATTATVVSLWKMYYDINQVLGISISENAGKSLTSAVVTNLSSAAAQGAATVVSEGAKFIPFVGWIASAGISTVASTAIVYGAAYLYLNALLAMYNAKGKFDFNYLESELTDKNYLDTEIEEELDQYNDKDDDVIEYKDFRQCIQAYVEDEYDNIDTLIEQVDRLIYDCVDEDEETNLNLLAAVACLDEFLKIYRAHCTLQEYILPYLYQGIDYINNATNTGDSIEIKVIETCFNAHYQFWGEHNFNSDFYNKTYIQKFDKTINELSCDIFSEEYIESLYKNTFSNILYYCIPNGNERIDEYENGSEFNEEEMDNNEDYSHISSSLTEAEEEYLAEYKEMLADGEISDRDRRFLNKIKEANGISDSRVKEIETMALTPSLTNEEQEYLDEYREIISEGEISARDQRYLDKLKKTNRISESRAKEIEAMV